MSEKVCDYCMQFETCCDGLRAEVKRLEEYKIQLEAWQSVFGSSQLTHAKDRLDVAEKEVELLKRKLAGKENA